MPIRAGQVTVTTSPTRLDVFEPVTGVYGQAVSISIRNAGAQSVWVGGPDVVAALSYEIPAGGVFAIDVTPPEQLWGRVTAGNALCQIIMTNAI